MLNAVSLRLQGKFSIVTFFSGVGGIELGFEQSNELRVVYAMSLITMTDLLIS
ncbi:TPA: hypothetical protein ACGO8D_000548 [Streptococcus suis]